jgi:hypothetical protein
MNRYLVEKDIELSEKYLGLILGNNSEFNTKHEWLTELHNTYEKIVVRLKELEAELLKIVNKVNLIHLLAYVSENFEFSLNNNKYSLNVSRILPPITEYVSGLCLKQNKYRGRPLDYVEVHEVLNNFQALFFFHLVIIQGKWEPGKSHKESSISDLLFSAKTLLYTTGGYRQKILVDQLEDLLENFYKKIDDFYQKKYGFTVEDAYSFASKIITYLENSLTKTDKLVKESIDMLKEKLKDPIEGEKIRSSFHNLVNSDEEYFDIHYRGHMHKSIRRALDFHFYHILFDLDLIHKSSSFRSYLDTFSCKFGDQDITFQTPLDENIIFTKPFITFDKCDYICPSPSNLLYTLPAQLDKLVIDNQKDNKLWNKYIKHRSKYCEEKTYEYLSRIFPEECIYKNLYYNHKGKRREIDVLVIYDNFVLIFQCKANYLNKKARKGYLVSIREELKEIVEYARDQAHDAKEFIESFEGNEIPFFNKKNKLVLNIPKHLKLDNYLFINPTLTQISSLTFSMKRLVALGLLENQVFPWTVNIFDLDIILRFIPKPYYFIHYIKHRISAYDDDIFSFKDELAYFDHYFEYCNFYPPKNKKGEAPKFVFNDPLNSTSIFIDYLEGQSSKPKFGIQKTFEQLLEEINSGNMYGKTSIICDLLDIDKFPRKELIKIIKKCIKQAIDDDFFSDTYLNFGKIGFIYFVAPPDQNLVVLYERYCKLIKYKNKHDKIIGIYKDSGVQQGLSQLITYMWDPWEKNNAMEQLMKHDMNDLLFTEYLLNIT